MSRRSALLALYGALSPAAAALVPIAAPFSAKLREGLAGRRGLMPRLRAASPALHGCVWFHVTSVGEYEQARPVIAALKELPDAPPVAVTHFSPSGHGYGRRRPCGDVHEYLPLDTPRAMAAVLDAWRPRALVFVKFDCWPNQVVAAAERDVPIVLLAGTLQPRSARLWPSLRPFFRALFDRFAHLGVCAEEDRDRFVRLLGVSAPVTVTGDTRADQVIRRYDASAGGAVAERLAALGGRRLVLGSTWPRDERIWLDALPTLLDRCPDLRVILAPHEPSPARLRDLERALAARSVGTRRLSALLEGELPPAEAPRCLLVDSVGILAELYRGASLAYVGGSFTTGVHNTMEPAVAAAPVLFGPVIQNAAEAGLLLTRGGARVVRTARDAVDAAAGWLGDPARLASDGATARATVLAMGGATTRSLALLRDCW
jgi:3-deoxy-D-manno-octulosonic-acid transferase